MQRRDFLKLSATAGAVSCITACGSKSSDSPAPVTPVEEQLNYSACLVNCGSNCPVKVFSVDGVCTRVETDWSETENYLSGQQVRACVRGRSLRQRNYAPDRLKRPLKRKAGTKRGAGQWEEISWEQAFSEIGAKTTNLRGSYGNESIYMHYGSGAYYTFAHANCIRRALAQSGGYLGYYSNYSWAALREAAPATFGSGTGGTKGTSLAQVAHSDVFVGIGYNPFEMRMSGSGEQQDFLHALTDANGNKRGDLDITIIDPRYTDSNLGKEDTWLPIRPGTDAALCEAIAYQMISSGWVNANSKAWIDEHCIGYDKASLEQAKLDTPEYAEFIDSDNNYHDHIMGVANSATDGIAKTPEWAAAITGIPAQAIIELADKIMGASAPFIIAGAGPNRQANGEQTMRAIYMLNVLTGKIGQDGITNGELPNNQSVYPGRLGDGGNPVSAKICFFDWTEAVERGDEMSWASHGVTGLDSDTATLPSKIKAIFNASGNALMNQHADINKSRALLEDESKVELLVVVDCWMTATAKMADYVLPDTSWLESDDITYDGYASGDSVSQVYMSSALNPFYDCKNMYQIGLGLCEAMGGDVAAYTEGKTEAQWLEQYYQAAKGKFEAKGVMDLPSSFEEAKKVGIKRAHVTDTTTVPAMQSFLTGSEALKTPSGKIEIYSLKWAKQATIRTPFSADAVDQIDAMSKYVPTWEGYQDTDGTSANYPFQVVGYHTKGRVHSSYHNVEWLREAVEDCVWMNPMDVAEQGLSGVELVNVSSPRGTIEMRLRSTPRVAPGVVGIAQGAWYNAEQVGAVDKGGCSNVLTKYHPAPYGRGNTQHTIRVNIAKA